MKLRSLWAALLAAALFLTGCTPSGSSSEPETSGYDLTRLTNEYLAPIAISGIGAVNWEDPSELSPDQLLSYYVVWAMPVERNLEEPEKVPAEELEQKLQERFDVSAELLRQSEYYDPETGLYTPGYVGSSARYEVTGAREEDGCLLLDYEYYSPADDKTVIRQGTLTLEKYGDGYRYLSCVTEPVPSEPQPQTGD